MLMIKTVNNLLEVYHTFASTSLHHYDKNGTKEHHFTVLVLSRLKPLQSNKNSASLYCWRLRSSLISETGDITRYILNLRSLWRFGIVNAALK